MKVSNKNTRIIKQKIVIKSKKKIKKKIKKMTAV